MFRVAWFRFRATFARRWTGYLALVLLIGLLGGLALGVSAGARRTQSSYPTFLQSTNPSDLSIVGAPAEPERHAAGDASRTCPAYARRERTACRSPGRSPPNGAPTPAALNAIPLGSIDGLGFDQDRLTAVQGRVADPTRADEVIVTVGRGAGASVCTSGDRLAIGVFTARAGAAPRVRHRQGPADAAGST